jgi:hypothetical protein
MKKKESGDFYERYKVPSWANTVEVEVSDGVVKVDFDTEDEEIYDNEDL